MRHDFTLEEIKENNYSKIAKAVDPWLVGKHTISNLLDG
jgi:hypothetical protein